MERRTPACKEGLNRDNREPNGYLGLTQSIAEPMKLAR